MKNTDTITPKYDSIFDEIHALYHEFYRTKGRAPSHLKLNEGQYAALNLEMLQHMHQYSIEECRTKKKFLGMNIEVHVENHQRIEVY